MPPIIWSPKATKDIQLAYKFLASKDIAAAKAAAKAIIKQVEILEIFPHAGRPSEDLDPEQRELLIPFGASGYVLLYHINEIGSIYIVAVRHQKEAQY